MGDILQILGVGNQLAKQRPSALELAQLLLALVFLGLSLDQAVSAHQAVDRSDAAGQGKLHFQPLGSEAGLTAQAHHDAGQAGASLVGTVMGTAGTFCQRGGLARLVTTQPFAHGVARTTKHTGGVFDAVGPRVAHQLLMQPVSIGFHAIQFEVAGVHEPTVLSDWPLRGHLRRWPRSSRSLRSLTTFNFTTGGSRCTCSFPCGFLSLLDGLWCRSLM